jgi:hypothetical protein
MERTLSVIEIFSFNVHSMYLDVCPQLKICLKSLPSGITFLTSTSLSRSTQVRLVPMKSDIVYITFFSLIKLRYPIFASILITNSYKLRKQFKIL